MVSHIIVLLTLLDNVYDAVVMIHYSCVNSFYPFYFMNMN